MSDFSAYDISSWIDRGMLISLKDTVTKSASIIKRDGAEALVAMSFAPFSAMHLHGALPQSIATERLGSPVAIGIGIARNMQTVPDGYWPKLVTHIASWPALSDEVIQPDFDSL